MQATQSAAVLAGEIMWVYLLIFLAIPLMRVLPRIIRRLREQSGRPAVNGYAGSAPSEDRRRPPDWRVTSGGKSDAPPHPRDGDIDMQILGNMIAGDRTFESIQKHTRLDAKRLDSILQDLEKRSLIRVEHRRRLMGMRVELHVTNRGRREFRN